jgi:excisionase family DNA binding protein
MNAAAPMMRPDEVASELRLSRVRVYALIRSGEIPATRVGGAIRIPREAWLTWLSARAHDALGRSPSRGGED